MNSTPAKITRSRLQYNVDSLRGFSEDQQNTYQSASTSTETSTPHNRTHCNEISLKRFKCHICSYSSNSKHNLKTHSLVHSGERPYKCERCNRTFTQLSHLRRHKLLHTGEKPFSCDVCNASFRQPVHLRLHMSKHHL